MIKLEKVSKIFHSGGKEIPAVQDVTLDIQEGEIFSVRAFACYSPHLCLFLLEIEFILMPFHIFVNPYFYFF